MKPTSTKSSVTSEAPEINVLSVGSRRLQRCLLVLAAFLVGLLLVEGLCRCLHLFVPPMLLAKDDIPAAGHPHSPYCRGHFAEENRLWAAKGVPFKELGYRSPYTLATATNGVLVLGDSFAFAQGVREGFAELLQQSLAPQPVVNLGVDGAGLDNMAYQLRNFVDALKPRLVICAVYADDLRRQQPDFMLTRNRPVGCLRAGQLTFLPASEALPHPFLYYHSRVYQIDNYILRKRREQLAANLLTFGPLYSFNDTLLLEMKSLCQQHNSQFMVMFIPMYYIIMSNSFVKKFAEPVALRRMCRLHQIPFLDLTPSLQDQTASFYLSLPNDRHFNEKGHRSAFDQLRQFINANHLLEPTAQ